MARGSLGTIGRAFNQSTSMEYFTKTLFLQLFHIFTKKSVLPEQIKLLITCTGTLFGSRRTDIGVTSHDSRLFNRSYTVSLCRSRGGWVLLVQWILCRPVLLQIIGLQGVIPIWYLTLCLGLTGYHHIRHSRKGRNHLFYFEIFLQALLILGPLQSCLEWQQEKVWQRRPQTNQRY